MVLDEATRSLELVAMLLPAQSFRQVGGGWRWKENGCNWDKILM